MKLFYLFFPFNNSNDIFMRNPILSKVLRKHQKAMTVIIIVVNTNKAFFNELGL